MQGLMNFSNKLPCFKGEPDQLRFLDRKAYSKPRLDFKQPPFKNEEILNFFLFKKKRRRQHQVSFRSGTHAATERNVFRLAVPYDI